MSADVIPAETTVAAADRPSGQEGGPSEHLA